MNGALIALVILIIIIAAAYYVYVTYGSLPSSLYSTLSSGKQLNATVLEGIILQKVNASPTYNLGYEGHVTTSAGDPVITFNYLKYVNDRRAVFTSQGLPVFGNASVTIISLNNSASGYLCVNTTNSSALNSLVPGGSNGVYRCTSAVSAEGQLQGVVDLLVNVSTLSNMVTGSPSVGSYDGQPCYSISGTASVDINSSLVGATGNAQTPSNVSFSACLSASEDIPLTLNATFTASNGGTVVVSAYNTGINLNATQAQVTSLPGGLVP